MKKEITITLEYEDGPWFSEFEGKWYETDTMGYAMDIVREITLPCAEKFVEAKLDGALLVSKNGEAPDVVKRLPQYNNLMRILRSIT